MADNTTPDSPADDTASATGIPAVNPESAQSSDPSGDGSSGDSAGDSGTSLSRTPRLPGWLARINPKVAAATVGMLVFGGAGYAIGNHAPSARSSSDQAIYAPGVRTDNLGRPEGKSSSMTDADVATKQGVYYSNILTADAPDAWAGVAAGEMRAGYAPSVDEAARIAFTDRLLVALGLPAKAKADGSVEWSECEGNLCRSLGVMADNEGTFNATVGNWPGSCVESMPGSTGMMVPKGAPVETAIAPAPSTSASSSDPRVDPIPMPAVPETSCATPKPAPAVDAVTKAAGAWVPMLGLTDATSDVVVTRDDASYVANAYIYQVIDGQRVRVMATLTYAGGPELVAVYGSFAKLEKVADYTVISAADAVKRTHDAQWGVTSQQVWDMTMPIAYDTGVGIQSNPTASPLQPGKLNGRVEDVVVTDPKPSLMQMFDVSGNSVWVPAYRVTDKATGKTRWDVAAIASSYFGG